MSLNGCYNRQPFKPVMRVRDGYYHIHTYQDGGVAVAPREVEIENRGSYDCQYTRSKKTNGDPNCVGCKWKSTNPDLEH